MLTAMLGACEGTEWCALPEVTPTVRAGEGGNVLVVVLDDIGIDQLSAWEVGSEVAQTPTIDCLCERGVRFTDAWASPLCSPARAAMLSGQYPHRYGINRFLHAQNSPLELPLEVETFGEVAQSAGYATGFAGKWHVSTYVSPSGLDHPNLQGFDWYGGAISNLEHGVDRDPDLDYNRWEKVTNGEARLVQDYVTAVNVDDALQLAQTLPEPWLIVLSFNAPHVPVHVPPRRILKADQPGPNASEGEQYRAMIQAIDIELNRLLTRMDAQVLADTSVVLFGDNGTPSHGVVAPVPPERHKGSLYEGGVRVPLVVTGPHVAERNVESDALVSLVDLLPTIASIAGVAAPPDLDGRSLLPVLADPSLEVHDTLYAHNEGPDGRIGHIARNRNFKLWRSHGGSEALYRMQGVAETLDEGEPLERADWGKAEETAYFRLRAVIDEAEQVLQDLP